MRMQACDTVTVTVTVTNTGDKDGDEVVQVYLKHVKASVPVPKVRDFIILLFHDGVTPIRMINKCDRTGTSQKQLDGN